MSTEVLMKTLSDLSIPMTLAVGGTAAVVSLLWLATFSWRHIGMAGGIWLLIGISCTVFCLVSPTAFFLSIMIAGLPLILLPSIIGPSKKVRGWVLYVVWAYFWIAAFIGWRYGWLGLLTITLPALLIAELGLFFVAGFLLPFPEQALYRGGRPAPEAGEMPTFGREIRDLFDLIRYPENKDVWKQRIEQRRKALRCLLTFALGTNYPYYVVIDEKIAERTEETRTWLTEEEKLIKRVEGDLFGSFLAGPGVILTGCDQAVVLSTGQKFKGAKGPGVIFTDFADSPTHIVDLRVQLHTFPVEAWTKDGIAVRVVTFIPFQIGTGKELPALGKGFPYRSSDIFKAIHAQLMEHVDLSQVPENLKQHAWYDLPRLACERIMREIISRYEFDDLYAPFELHADTGQPPPRFRIARELAERLDQVLPDWGIQRTGGGISNIMPVDERVIEQRIEAWRADWAREIMLKQAAGQSERLRLVEQARAQAQVDIVLAVGKQIEQLRVAGADVVARYFIEVLTELSGRAALRQLLPRDTSNILRAFGGGEGPASVPASVEGEQTGARET
jgi:hypothetical protein